MDITIAERVLREIERRGGLTTTECKRFIVQDVKGWNFDERIPHHYTPDRTIRKYQSYWSTNLLGGGFFAKTIGLLPNFCTKGKDGKWRVSEKIEAPFFRQAPTKTWRRAEAKRKRIFKKKRDAAPHCPHCGTSAYGHENLAFLTALADAHVNLWGRGYRGDCKGRALTDQNEPTIFTTLQVRNIVDEFVSRWGWDHLSSFIESLMKRSLKGEKSGPDVV